jgi:hypothetical protein
LMVVRMVIIVMMVMIVVGMGVFVAVFVDMSMRVIVIRDGTAAIFAHNKVLKKYILVCHSQLDWESSSFSKMDSRLRGNDGGSDNKASISG